MKQELVKNKGYKTGTFRYVIQMIEENQQEYTFEYSNKYQLHIELHKKSGQKKIIDKIATFLHELSIHPTTGTGQVEQLKHFGERNVYSRRIDKKHRLTYEVFEEEKRVELLSAYGHYE